MTIEELLNFPDPATLSDADLDKILAPYFPLTRPRNLGVAQPMAGVLPPDIRARVDAAKAALDANNLLTKLRPKP